MRIHVMAPQRRKPEIGDRRTTKKHGLQIRVVSTTSAGAWLVRGSRPVYEWCTPAEIKGSRWDYLLKPGDLPEQK